MKKITGLCVFVAALGIANMTHAQSKMETTAQETSKDSNNASQKEPETIVLNKSSKVDGQPFKDMVGPDGQAIYIDRKAKYFWIDSKGTHHYINKEELHMKQKEQEDWLKDGMRYI